MIDALRIAFPGKPLVLTETGPRREPTARLAGSHRLPMIGRRAHPGDVQPLRLPDVPQTLPGAQEMRRQIPNRCPLLAKVKSRVQQSILKEHVL